MLYYHHNSLLATIGGISSFIGGIINVSRKIDGSVTNNGGIGAGMSKAATVVCKSKAVGWS